MIFFFELEWEVQYLRGLKGQPIRKGRQIWKDTLPFWGPVQSLEAPWCELSLMSLWPKWVAPPEQSKQPR